MIDLPEIHVEKEPAVMQALFVLSRVLHKKIVKKFCVSLFLIIFAAEYYPFEKIYC